MSKKLHHAALDHLNPQPGDSVRVLFAVPDYAHGWVGGWVAGMNACIGNTYTVMQSDSSRGVQVVVDSVQAHWFPAFCLELVSRAAATVKKETPLAKNITVDLTITLGGE